MSETTVQPVAALTAADVMSPLPVTVQPHESLLSAWVLLDRGGFRHLPVVGGDGRCLGLLDDRLVSIAMGVHSLVTKTVGDVMPARVHCVRPEDSVRAIAEMMLQDRSTALPVVDDRDHLLGIVTDRDLVQVLADRCASGY